MKKVNCIIVDDEVLAQDILEEYVNRIDELHLLAKCSNAVEAYNLLQKENVDLIFLDIQMPKLTGVEFMSSLTNPPKVIFTTAYSEYAVKGFELEAIDYLLKPISFDRFLKAVNKVLNIKSETDSEKEDHQDAFIYLKSDGMMAKIKLSDINYIESVRNCIHVHTTKKTIVSYVSISSIEERLPDSLFLRVHRSFIISRSKIDAFSHNLVEVAGEKIPVGRNYKDSFQEKMGDFFK